ncbi:hypothetical protein V9T40_013071 [Parthenolecanium corni]|uniref:Uncharacterized protein n=1 Tax=Parthenolecanium corni TaxID=536013 RepID=A0AAN9Y5C6_9HEMI
MPFSTSASANTVCSTNHDCRSTTTAAAVAAGRSSTGENTSFQMEHEVKWNHPDVWNHGEPDNPENEAQGTYVSNITAS